MVAASFKVCCMCGEALPVSAFGFYSQRTQRLRSRCKACHNLYMRDYRRQRRHARLGKHIRRLGVLRPAEKLSQVVGLMLASMGGLNGFVTAFHQLWREAGTTRDGIRLRTSMCVAALRMIEASDAAKNPNYVTECYADLTTKEVVRERDCLIAEAARNATAANSRTDT
jgi:hypothetical protein